MFSRCREIKTTCSTDLLIHGRDGRLKINAVTRAGTSAFPFRFDIDMYTLRISIDIFAR